MSQPETQKLRPEWLRTGRSYHGITPDLLRRAMGFSPATMWKYVRTGLLPSFEYRGETWVVSPRDCWRGFLQTSAMITDRIAGCKNSRRRLATMPYLTTRDVSELLDVSQRYVQRLAAEGFLPYVRINPRGPYRFALVDVTRYMNRRIRGMTPMKAGQARTKLLAIRKVLRSQVR